MSKKSKLLFHNNEWSFDTIHKTWDVVRKIGIDKYGLDFYEPRFELIDFDGMLNAYSTNAMPNLYSHWSFGRNYVEEYNKYKDTQSLAFEVVINSNPSICYLMDSNTATTQALVIAHAAVGHSSFFKNNHMFKTHTNADTIIAFLARSSARIKEMEVKYGIEEVEGVIDLLHSLRNYSFDKHTMKKLTPKQRAQEAKELSEARDKYYDKILDVSLEKAVANSQNEAFKRIKEEEDYYFGFGEQHPIEENVLKFIMQNSIDIPSWERELIGIFLEVNQYFYPQMHTQLMNEGWASFWHYTIMNDLYTEGYIDESSYFEFVQLHCSVLRQPSVKEGYMHLNPYKLGFDMYQDIKRISMEPTEEDHRWFPDWAGNGDWLSTIKFAMKTYKDESFISQYLSPKVIRDYKFMVVEHDFDRRMIEVIGDHTEQYYNRIVNLVSKRYDLFDKIPTIGVSFSETSKASLNLYIEPDQNGKQLTQRTTRDLVSTVSALWHGNVELCVGRTR